MTKILYFLCLSSIRFVVTESTSESETKSPNIANESLLTKLDNNKDEFNESALPAVIGKCDNEFSKDTQRDDPESPEIPVDNLLDMVQNELNKSEDVEKAKYLNFLTHLHEVLEEDIQKVKVFFKSTWRTVDLGLRGSSKRQRSAITAQGMLQSLQDLWTWLCRRFFSLAMWFKSDGSEKEIEHLNNIDHDEKVKLLEKHSEEREVYYATNPANPVKKEIADSKVK